MISFGLIGYGKLGKCLAKRWDDEGLSFKVFSNFNRAKKPKSLRIAENLEELVKESKVIFLAVPPNQIKQVIKECSEISEEKQFVSLAASVSLESLKELNSPYIARFMTSTFCEKGLAMGFLAGKYKGEWEPDLIEILEYLGSVQKEKDDSRFSLLTAATACSPAYLALTAEAYIEACINSGMPLTEAQQSAAFLFQSLGKVLEEQDPFKIRTQVMTPGGSTVAGLTAFYESNGLKKQWFEAISRAKSKC